MAWIALAPPSLLEDTLMLHHKLGKPKIVLLLLYVVVFVVVTYTLSLYICNGRNIIL